MPLAKNVYYYYHQLALGRMQDCNRLSYWLGDFYPPKGDWEAVYSSSDTEAHECEREALTYEMFAQHFLQDAWSTGHMWYRWGVPEPDLFPSTFDGRYEAPVPNVPPENIPGRRALIAGVTAAFAGMVHGSKAVIGADDPLNFPFFFDVANFAKPVHWSGKDGLIATGVGDLYSRYLLAQNSDYFQPQRGRILMCMAKSMREVYESGPKAHGPLGAFQTPGDPNDFDFDSECWAQLATNESMLGAVAPYNVNYASLTPLLPGGLPIVGPWIGLPLFGVANSVVIYNYAEAPTLPNTEDRVYFIGALGVRMSMDALSIVFDYLDNIHKFADENADGTESARGIRWDSNNYKISFLGVNPNQERSGSPPVATLDLPQPAVPEGDRPSSYYLRRMFWRAHPEDTCGAPGLAAQLRDQCVAAASQPGGDPEACTRCVEVAELQVPACYLNSDTLGPSKCAALGLPSLGGVDPAFSSKDCAEKMGLQGLPAYYSALHYCTGTGPIQFEENRLAGVEALSASNQAEIDCRKYDPNAIDPLHYYVPEVNTRIAVALSENEWEGRLATDDGYFTSSNFLPPIVTALNDKRTFTMLDEARFCKEGKLAMREEIGLQPLVDKLIAPLSYWDSFAHGSTALVGFQDHPADPLELETCGLTQRVSYHNRDCPTSLQALEKDAWRDFYLLEGQGLDPSTGVEVTPTTADDGMRCSIREPRYLKTTCVQGACNANGLCSSLPRAEVMLFGQH